MFQSSKIILLIFSLFIFGCGGSKEAEYKYNSEHKLLDENQLSTEVASSPKKLNLILNNVSSKVKSNFSWDLFWSTLRSKWPKIDFDMASFNELIYLGTKTCSKNNFESIQQLIFNYDFKSVNNQSELAKFYLLQHNLFQACYSYNGNLNHENLRRVHKYAHKINTDEFVGAILNIIKIDSIINNSMTIEESSFNTFNAREFSIIIKDYAANSDLKNFTLLLQLHKEMSPFSSKDRSKLLLEYLGNNERRKEIMKVSSAQDINIVVEEISREEQVTTPQETILYLIDSIISKIESDYKITSRFDNIEEILSLLWRDYSKLFDNLNNSKGIIKDKRKLLIAFNRANKVFENIIKLPINRSIMIDFLESVESTNELLIRSHLSKLQSRELHGSHLKENILNFRKNSNPSLLEQLLINRLKIYALDETAVDQFCELMEKKFGIKSKDLSHKKVKNILTTGEIGCFNIKFDNELKPLGYNFKQSEVKYNNLVINDINRIDTFSDLLLKVPDTNIDISTNYYNGPIWANNSRREIPIIPHRLPNLDARVTPVVFRVNVKKKNNPNAVKESMVFIYNHDFKTSEDVPNIDEIIDINKLRKGINGGAFKLTVHDKASFFPFVFNKGGKGQPGPEKLEAGRGFKISEIGLKAFDLDDELTEYLFINDELLDYTTPNYESILSLKSYEILDFDIDEWATKRLHKNLCGEEVNLSSRVCYVEGHQYKIDSLKNLEDDQYLFKELRERFIHLESILYRADATTKFLKREFTFPPQSNDKTSALEFPNGEEGKRGTLDVAFGTN